MSENTIPDQAVGVNPLTACFMHWGMSSWARIDFLTLGCRAICHPAGLANAQLVRYILLSKADKLSNSEKTLTLRRVEQELAARDAVTVQLFSSLSRLGGEEAAAVVESWFAQIPQQEAAE